MSRTRTLTTTGLVVVIAVFCLALFLNYLSINSQHPAPVSATVSPSSTTAAFHPGTQTKTTGCTAQGTLQDTACTPGAVFPDVTISQICTSGYASSVRDVPTSEKDQVYAEYGIQRHTTGEYEVDHLISLELGGSNDIANLWPEAASPKPGFHEKDKVENYLHEQVCNGKMSLPEAQEKIATDWLGIYNQIY